MYPKTKGIVNLDPLCDHHSCSSCPGMVLHGVPSPIIPHPPSSPLQVLSLHYSYCCTFYPGTYLVAHAILPLTIVPSCKGKVVVVEDKGKYGYVAADDEDIAH